MIVFKRVAGLFFLLTAMYAVWILRREIRHQRTLGWPSATATLAEGPDRLPMGYRDNFRNVQYFRAELEETYVFYARGDRSTGNRLAPGMNQISLAEAGPFLQQLARHRRYRVVFNPDDPTDNYLTAGKEVMGYSEVVLLALVGIFIPYLILVWSDTWGDMSGASLVLLLLFGPSFSLVLHHATKSPVQLAQLLEVDTEEERLELENLSRSTKKASILRSAAKKS